MDIAWRWTPSAAGPDPLSGSPPGRRHSRRCHRHDGANQEQQRRSRQPRSDHGDLAWLSEGWENAIAGTRARSKAASTARLAVTVRYASACDSEPIDEGNVRLGVRTVSVLAGDGNVLRDLIGTSRGDGGVRARLAPTWRRRAGGQAGPTARRACRPARGHRWPRPPGSSGSVFHPSGSRRRDRAARLPWHGGSRDPHRRPAPA